MLPTLAQVARSGAVRDARAEAERHADAALELLTQLESSIDADPLRHVVASAVDRRA